MDEEGKRCCTARDAEAMECVSDAIMRDVSGSSPTKMRDVTVSTDRIELTIGHADGSAFRYKVSMECLTECQETAKSDASTEAGETATNEGAEATTESGEAGNAAEATQPQTA